MSARCCVCVPCGSLLSCSTQTTQHTHGCRAFGRALPNCSPCRSEASSALQTVTSVSTSRTPCHRQHAHLHNAPLSSQCHSLCPLAGHARSALKRTATAGSPLSFSSPLLHARTQTAASRCPLLLLRPTHDTPLRNCSPLPPHHNIPQHPHSPPHTHNTILCRFRALSPINGRIRARGAAPLRPHVRGSNPRARLAGCFHLRFFCRTALPAAAAAARGAKLRGLRLNGGVERLVALEGGRLVPDKASIHRAHAARSAALAQ